MWRKPWSRAVSSQEISGRGVEGGSVRSLRGRSGRTQWRALSQLLVGSLEHAICACAKLYRIAVCMPFLFQRLSSETALSWVH